MTRFTTLILLTLMLNSCSENKIIYIAPAMHDCEEGDEKKCLQFKENKEDDWQLFNGDIDGFNYKEGFLYKIEVKISKAKGSSKEDEQLTFELVQIIYQESSKQAVLPNVSIEGQWTVKRLSGVDTLEKEPTLSFKDGQISGNAGCNNYSASCNIEGNSLAIGLAMATKMYCTNMTIEKAFFDCLKKAKTFKKEGKVLFIYDGNGDELLFCQLDSD